MQNPCIDNWNIVIHILKYIKGSKGKDCCMRTKKILKLRVLRWRLVGCPANRRFTLWYWVFIGGNIVSSKCRKQNVFVWSKAKAKYRSWLL